MAAGPKGTRLEGGSHWLLVGQLEHQINNDSDILSQVEIYKWKSKSPCGEAAAEVRGGASGGERREGWRDGGRFYIKRECQVINVEKVV